VKDLRTFSQSDTKRGLCSSDQKDKVIPLDTDTKQNVHAVVRKLFERQMNHAAKCEGILRQMFTIRREENLPVQIKISDALLKGGVAALNKINSQVRQILIEYYSDCESMYLTGVRHIEHQGIIKRQKDDAQKKQATQLVQKQLLEKQATQKATLDAQAPAQPPRGTTDAAARPLPSGQNPSASPVVSRPIPSAPPLTVPTVAQQAARRGQQMYDRSEYIEAVTPILKGKFSGEAHLLNTVRSITTRLEDMSPRIPVERLQAMDKSDIRKIGSTGARMSRSQAAAVAAAAGTTRTAGGTRKNITSSFRTTRRLLR
jgi:hypothetical protein